MKRSMLQICFFSVLFLSASISIYPQQNDPIHWSGPIHVQSKNIFMLWSQQVNGGTDLVSRQKIYKYYLKDSSKSVNQRLSGTQVHQDTAAAVSGNRQMDVAAGYFTIGRFENVVAAWEGPNQTIQLMIPHFDTSANAWSESGELTFPGPVVQYGAQQRGRIYVRTGDFLGTGKDQFVLAFQGADSTIHLRVYDVDNSLVPHLIASINDEKLLPIPSDLARFSVTAGDLNGDGKDEIILDGIEQNYNGSGKWALYAKVYDVSGSSLIPETRSIIFIEPSNYSIQAPVFGITTGQFKKNGEDQVGLVCAANEQGGNNAYIFIYMLESAHDLSNLTYDITKRDSIKTDLGGSINDFSIASGDLNNAGRDELVYDLNGTIYVYSTDDLLNLTYRQSMNGLSSGVYDNQLSFDFLKIGDLNYDGSDDIVIEKDIYSNQTNHWLALTVYTISQDLSKHSVFAAIETDTSTYNNTNSYYNYALALGNFDGSTLTIGRPNHTVESNIVQPLVVLNTPPIHFDILNGNKYDLNNSFNGNVPGFYSTYEQQSTQSVNMITSTHNDVSDAAGVNLSGNIGASIQEEAAPLGVGVQISQSIATNFLIKVEGTWGHSYSSEKSTTHTTSLDIGVSAKGDDQIYAITSSYNIWTYPVYIGNDTSSVVNYINFASPVNPTGAWFPSKTYASNFYIPNHEVGNILSYLPSDSAMNNPDIDSSIVSIAQSQGLPISGQSGSYWDLDYTKYSQSTLDSTWHSGWDINYNFGAPAFSSVGNNAHFTSTTTSIMSGFDLRATFGSIVDSLGNIAAYTVFPYAYRSKNGAVVINYAVDPVIAGQGQSQSWWQVEYGRHSDPTFILPWFYDPEKGMALTENVKRYQTTDIFFNNYAPQPGDTIKITARVRNFSLAATPTPVSVKFYVGDPDSGGTIITGINGADSAATLSYIRNRGWSDANINWVVPSGLPQYPRIYAVADPDNQIQEVHENNNKGFSVLGRQSTVSGINTVKTVPGTYTLYQSFPNPFNPAATIRYSIPMGNHVIIKIYDILGRELATLVDRYEGAGTYNVKFNGENYASGVYFYRIHAGSFVQTKKMLLLK